MQKEDWNPMIAASVNENLLSLVIDNKEYTNEEYSFYMNDELRFNQISDKLLNTSIWTKTGVETKFEPELYLPAQSPNSFPDR